MKTIEPELTWTGRGFEPSLQIELLDDGTIGRIGSSLTPNPQRLPGEALVPGFVNAHSHAFQRGLRGRAESFGTFWSWRDEMYRLVESLGRERFRRLTALTFREMLRSGITAVGEFHYLHHEPGSRGYELDDAVLEAARETGIRLVLLDVLYMTGDMGKPLEGAQRRFQSGSVAELLASVWRLKSLLDPRRESLGLVAHSLRAAPLEAVVELHEEAIRHGLPFHMHVEEQPKEIEASLGHYGRRPLALLLDRLRMGPETTFVHCTHSREEDLKRLFATGANICLCPLTEASLADGIPSKEIAAGASHLCLGTDSNLRIDPTEEMRLLEYAQRLREERRGVFTDDAGAVAPRLFRIATEGGARALGLRAGRIETGCLADFATLDLGAPELSEAGPHDLLTAFVFGAGNSVLRRVAVGGEWVYSRNPE